MEVNRDIIKIAVCYSKKPEMYNKKGAMRIATLEKRDKSTGVYSHLMEIEKVFCHCFACDTHHLL